MHSWGPDVSLLGLDQALDQLSHGDPSSHHEHSFLENCACLGVAASALAPDLRVEVCEADKISQPLLCLLGNPKQEKHVTS